VNVIVDYKCGNPASICNMLKKIGFQSVISDDPEVIRKADRIIFPGVGSFDFGAGSVRKSGIADAMEHKVFKERTPILGICVGLQLMCRTGEEGVLPGLGWIEADCVKFDNSRLGPEDKVPHMGWAEVTAKNDAGLLSGFEEEPSFYFVHSYHVRTDGDDIVAATAHHGYDFTAGIVKGNIAGVQFHPEKSHQFGMTFLGNFMRWNPAAQ